MTDYAVVEGEDPQVLSRNLISAGPAARERERVLLPRVLLRVLLSPVGEQPRLWKPKHVDASVTWGTIVMACIVLSAMLVRFGRMDQAAGRRGAFRLKGLVALALGSAALVAAGGRVDAAELRPDRRRLRERLLRVDGVPLALRPPDDVLARDDDRHLVAVPERADGRRAGRRRATRPAIPAGWRTTSATRWISTARRSWR